LSSSSKGAATEKKAPTQKGAATEKRQSELL